MEQNIQPNRPAVRPRTSSTQSKTAGEKSHSRRKIDLTGQRYGKLMVIEPAENVGGRTAWLCRCDCGRETVVRTNRLRSGHTSSCGCLAAGRETGLPGLTYVDGTSGVPGVDWLSAKQRWLAMICFKGKRHYLGSYARFEDAVKARKAAEEELHEGFLREYAQSTKQGPESPAV